DDATVGLADVAVGPRHASTGRRIAGVVAGRALGQPPVVADVMTDPADAVEPGRAGARSIGDHRALFTGPVVAVIERTIERTIGLEQQRVILDGAAELLVPLDLAGGTVGVVLQARGRGRVGGRVDVARPRVG